jgi:antitoxin (DNA-binding transcriptional repressor) of toxin-antitoxin stability system
MITVSKGVLKNKMLEIFRNAENSGEEIIVTDRHKPVLRITPIKQRKSLRQIFKPYQQKATFHTPATAPETMEWGELS